MGLDGKAKCEVGSGKWEKVNYPVLSRRRRTIRLFGPKLGLKENNLVGVGSLRPVGGSGMLLWLLWVAGGDRGRVMQRDVATYGTK